MSSDVIRNFEIAALQTMLPQIQAAGGNAVKVIKLALGQLKSINTDGILPEMDEQQEAEANAKIQASQAKQERLIDLQIAAATAQGEGFKAQQQAYEIKQQRELAEIDTNIKLNKSKINNTTADTIKKWEEAQALAIKNDMVNMGIKKAMDNVLTGGVSQPTMEEDGKPEMMEDKMEEEKPMVDIEINQGE